MALLVLTPQTRAISRSPAVARQARPSLVLLRMNQRMASRIAVSTKISSHAGWMITLPTRMTSMGNFRL